MAHKQIYSPDALYIRFDDFTDGDPVVRNLSPNTILLAYNLLRHYGLDRSIYIQNINSADDYVHGVSDAEFLLIQDIYEQALKELRDG